MINEKGSWGPLDTSSRNPALYRVVANNYNATFLKLIGGFTFGILKIVPKDRAGAPISDLAAARVDADRARPGIQELKEWVAFLEYARSFPDADRDGVPEIPARYASAEGRIVRSPSLSPVALLSGAGPVTWAALGAAVLALALLAGAAALIAGLVRRIRRRAG
jgi:hypothetical protein